MSQANVDVIRRANALVNAGDWDATLAIYHPKANWQDLAHAPDKPEKVHGREAIRAIWDERAKVFEASGRRSTSSSTPIRG